MCPAAPSPAQPQLPPELDRGEITALDHDVRIAEIELAEASLADQHANGDARLKRCEFRHTQLADIQGVKSLSGAAMMEWPNIVEMAGVWAAALGIEVLEC